MYDFPQPAGAPVLSMQPATLRMGVGVPVARIGFHFASDAYPKTHWAQTAPIVSPVQVPPASLKQVSTSFWISTSVHAPGVTGAAGLITGGLNVTPDRLHDLPASPSPAASLALPSVAPSV